MVLPERRALRRGHVVDDHSAKRHGKDRQLDEGRRECLMMRLDPRENLVVIKREPIAVAHASGAPPPPPRRTLSLRRCMWRANAKVHLRAINGKVIDWSTWRPTACTAKVVCHR